MRKLILLSVLLSSFLYTKATMSQKSYELLMEAQELIHTNKKDEASKILNKLLEKSNFYTKSYAYQFLSNLELEEGNYKKVAEYYEKIIKLNSFEKKSIDSIKLSLSKIYLSLEEYNKSIKLSYELLENSKIQKNSIYETLIYSYYYTQKHKKSVVYSKKYISTNKEKNENIYQLLYSSYVELKEYKNAINTLKTMIKVWYDKQNYWLQLISLYQEKKQYEKALSILELAYKKEVLEADKHTLFFAKLLLQNNLFKKGSLVLEEGISKGYIKEDKTIFELLITSYLNAKEYDKTIKKLEKSKFTKEDKFKKILVNLYYEKHDYQKTIHTIQKHQAKKKIDGDLCLILALAHYELENKEECKVNLQKALKDKKTKKRALKIAKVLKIQLDKVN